MAFNVFVIPLDQFADRVNLVVTIILCVVAFNFSIAGKLPVVPTATHMHRYFFMQYVFLGLIGVANVIAHKVFADFDVYCGWTLFGLYVLMNAVVLVRMVLAMRDVDAQAAAIEWAPPQD